MARVGWQRLRVPLMERLALDDMASRRGESEEEALARLIREAVMRDLARQDRAAEAVKAQPMGDAT
ncbi:MAG TPA: hypothetical protein VMV87_03445 [Burkholderiales bacterium]|nr:hypothetical protein [Burkholderiales bacterium]